MKTFLSLFVFGFLFNFQIFGQTLESNGICSDPIVGPGVYINNARTAGINLLGGVTSGPNVIDGDLSNYADMQLGVALLGGGSAISIKDSIQYYPSGNRVNVVVGIDGGVLNADVLSNLTINLYRNNSLVQTITTGSGLAYVGLLSGTVDKHKIGFIASGDFDEVQVIVSSTLSLLSSFRVYYVEEQPASCPTDCTLATTVSDGASIVGSRTGISGILCLLCSVSNSGNTVSNDTTDFTTITQTVGLAVTGSVSVNMGGVQPAGKEVGFAIETPSGLLSLSALSSIRITTYLGGTQRESFLANNGVVQVGLLSNSAIQTLSFITSNTFDEARITITPTLSLLNTTRIYYAFTRTDTDSDGVYDCLDKCSGNDLMDNDGDGIPDDCDPDDDNDTLTDIDETTIYLTNPKDGDTDDDGLYDNVEIFGLAPLSAATSPLLADTDGDGIQDGTEAGKTFPTPWTNTAIFVPDADPLTQTSPTMADTDGDSYSDGVEDANKNGRIDSGESNPLDPCDPTPCPIDLELLKTVNTNSAAIGDTLTYTLTLINANPLAPATGVIIMDYLPAEVLYISHTAEVGTTFDAGTGIWNVDSAMFVADTVTLQITVKVNGGGVITNQAQVISSDQTDIDSTPANNLSSEDDYAIACTSIPFQTCFGDTLVLRIDSSYTSYQWNYNGVPIPGATGSSYSATLPGSYTVNVDGEVGCVSGLCCPFVIMGGTVQDLVISGPTSVCAGASINLTASSSTGTIASYLWQLPNGTTSTAPNIGIGSSNVNHSGDYILTATLTTGCVVKDTLNVIVNQGITAPNVVAHCDNNGTPNDDSDDVFSFSVSPIGNISSTYSVSGNGITGNNLSFGTPSPSFGGFNILAGSFGITLTDDTSTCSLSVTVTPPSSCSSCGPVKCIPITIAKIN